MSEPNDSTGNDSDQDFDPSAEMMVNDFDDEHTLDEEEAELNEEENQDEINALTAEQDIPIEELLARYYPATIADQASSEAAAAGGSGGQASSAQGAPPQPSTSSSSATSSGSAGGQQSGGRTTATAGRAAVSSSTNANTSTAAATSSSSLLSDYESSESDDEFSANEDEWRRVIQVGADYQAVIPDGLNKYEEGDGEGELHVYEGGATSGAPLNSTSSSSSSSSNAFASTSAATSTRTSTRTAAENRDYLLWKPTPLLDDRTLDAFVREYEAMFDPELQSAAASGGTGGGGGSGGLGGSLPAGEHNRDDDHALYLLFKHGYSVEEALAAHHDAGPNGQHAEPTPIRKMMDPWTEDECRAFETGLRTHGKDFFTIKRERIGSRTVGEVVTFYYFWKKTERHDQFVTKYRIEKKKYALHPGTTDYMEKFLEDQENQLQYINAAAAAAAGGTAPVAPIMQLREANLAHQQQQQAGAMHHHQHHHHHHSSSSSGTSLLHHQAPNAASNFHLNPNRAGGGGGHQQQGGGGGHYQANSSNRSSSSNSRGDHHPHHHHSQHHSHHHHPNTSSTQLLINTSGGGVRTINISDSGEPQTIIINDSGEFNGGGGGGSGGGGHLHQI